MMRRVLTVLAVTVLAAGCAGGESVEDAARRMILDDDKSAFVSVGFTADEIGVAESFTDGDCAAVHVWEPSGMDDPEHFRMTVFMRDSDGWENVDMVTGHVGDMLDEDNVRCWAGGMTPEGPDD